MNCTSSAVDGVNFDFGTGVSVSFGYASAPWFYREFVSSEKRIELALEHAELDEGETRPNAQAISGIVHLVAVASKTTSLSQAEISVFYGDAIVTWRSGGREISLISKGNADEPKLLRYEAGSQAGASESKIISNATPEDLRQAAKWLSA